MSAYSAAILGHSGLTSYWRMNDASGSTAVASAGATNIVLVGSPSLSQAGAIANDDDTSIKFVRSSNQRGTASLALPTSAFSLEAWAMSTDKVNSYDCALASTWVSSSNGAMIYCGQVGVPVTGFDLRFYKPSSVFLNSNVQPANDVWFHVVCTWSAATGARIYVDGVEKNSTATTASPSTSTTFRVATYGSGMTGGFTGMIDEVAIYNVALSASDVLYHYNLGKGIIGNDQRSKPGRALQAVSRSAVM